MHYDTTRNIYTRKIWLKNGEYDYSYAIDDEKEINEFYFQGSHSETMNAYDILIYYRAFGAYYDQLIGYKKID